MVFLNGFIPSCYTHVVSRNRPDAADSLLSPKFVYKFEDLPFHVLRYERTFGVDVYLKGAAQSFEAQHQKSSDLPQIKFTVSAAL